ncbi:MAG: hypothetical protein ABJA98_34985 [Acidobacteriota bacterium]
MNRHQTWPAALLTASALCLGATSSCSAARRHAAIRPGIEMCPTGAADALLSVPALQCWFAARHGWWRTLSHESHFDVLVVHVEALDLRDAGDIAQRFVASEGTTFSEILIYAQAQSRADPHESAACAGPEKKGTRRSTSRPQSKI